jgi:2-polyprenyl-3-methyl-5-hydroxy-6-metoxy-1,4-benzoquinol methylase
MIPADAHRVLDVGCGFGALGRHLVETRGCEMHGVEKSAAAAAHLRGNYARFEIGDAQDVWCKLTDQTYDCIVFADVLEHLIDPWTTLRNYATLLAPGGAVVSSIPNVRNVALLINVALRGRWRYTDHGLLDRTHLRFFTRREIELLFAQAGLSIEAWATNRERFSGLRRIVAALPVLMIPELGVCQFIVRARPCRG